MLTEISLTPLVHKAFGAPVKCAVPEKPNVGALKWIDNRRIVVVAQIIQHSVCDSFGTFKAYEIDVRDRRVVRSYGQLVAKKRFADDLGSLVKDAPDHSVTDPRSCWVSTNHPSTKK